MSNKEQNLSCTNDDNRYCEYFTKNELNNKQSLKSTNLK